MENSWKKNSWKNFKTEQQPIWPNKNELTKNLLKLKKLPSLVFSGETRKLKKDLTKVNQGENFILQVGNCAESFTDCHGPKIHDFLRIFLQMAKILEFKANKNIIKIGRIAGQYAKPRSSNFEKVEGIRIPSYRGDIVNDFSPTLKARTPDPERLIEGYFRSASTLNLIRAFIQGGYDDICNTNDWKEHFFSNEISKLDYYKRFDKDITNSLNSRLKNISNHSKEDQLFISHEALLLDYEEAFTRIDTTSGGYYDTSAHFLWVGDRTRQLDSAHIEFVRGIRNPVGLKVGPDYDLKELIKVIQRINPENSKGRVVLISRMGYEKLAEKINPLIKKVIEHKLNVIWVCDPMHGNTFTHNNFKVRSFDHIVAEISSFFEICKNTGIAPGGIHLEITDENVTECIGGINGLTLSNLGDKYTSKVDPRLNAAQALEIAFIISELLNNSN